MLLEKFHSNPKKATQTATAMLCAGLAIGTVGARTGIGFGFTRNWFDFVRGFCIGLGISLECFAVAILAAARRRSH